MQLKPVLYGPENQTNKRHDMEKIQSLIEDRIIRVNELQKMIGCSRSTIWRFEKEGNFPKRIALGERAMGWRYSQVMQWIKTRQTIN